MQPSDEELLRAMRSGDEDAFLSLYQRWQTAIFRFGLQMTGSTATAEDVTQEVFLAIIRDSSGYCSSKGSFSSWLYGISRHVILRTTGRKKAAASLEDSWEEVDSQCAPDCDPHDDMVQRQQTHRLRKALLGLPAHYREAVVLCIFHEMNYAESACVIGCSVGTIRSRLHRARMILTERLRSEENGRAQTLKRVASDGGVL
jgi:RNA polymerase sigma-70 factor, ECF subfamily